MRFAARFARRAVTVAAVAALAAAPLAACSSDNVDCSLNSCTVTFERGVDAESSLLGVDVKLVRVDGENVTVSIGGTEVAVPVDGEASAEGFTIKVEEVTDKNVVLVVSKT